MAGDWLKMEASTPDKRETLAITETMGWTDPDLTVGKLFRVWRWFDQQTVDGNASGVTTALLDRVAGAIGFADAMASVGWLMITAGGLELPNFDRHNGSTAKSRALTARRVNNFKAGNAKGNAPNVTSALPREEKRREEKKKPLASREREISTREKPRVTAKAEAVLRQRLKEIRQDSGLMTLANTNPTLYDSEIRDRTGWGYHELAEITGDFGILPASEQVPQ